MQDKMYDCKCGRCGAEFQSANEIDTDGDGKCPDCLKRHRHIAERVEAELVKIRANRKPTPIIDKRNIYFEQGN